MNCKNCGRAKTMGQYWPNGLCSFCEVDEFASRQREAGAALTGAVTFKVVMGGSGRWLAAAVTGDPDGPRPRTGLPQFTGHVPRRAEDKLAVVRRQIERAWARGEFASRGDVNAAPRGGSSWRVTVEAPPRQEAQR